MAEIEIALRLYMQDHSGDIPDASSWCDLLVNDQFLNPDQLSFMSKNNKKRNYAFNVGASKHSEVPDDIVLVFESSSGWNMNGGKELLLGDTYKGGCWILLGDMRVKYVKPENFDDLRWE